MPNQVSPRDLKLREEAKQRRADADAHRERAATARLEAERLRSAWELSVTVVCAAALLAVATALVNPDTKANQEGPLAIAAWCFLGGLVASGTAPLLRSLHQTYVSRHLDVFAAEVEHGGPVPYPTGEYDHEYSGALIEAYQQRRNLLRRAALWTPRLAAALFLVGVAIPLTRLTVAAITSA